MYPYLQRPVSVLYAVQSEHTDLFARDGIAFFSRSGSDASFPTHSVEETFSLADKDGLRAGSPAFVIAFQDKICGVGNLYRVELCGNGELRSVAEPARLIIGQNKTEAESEDRMPWESVKIPFKSVNLRPVSDSSNMEVSKKISQLVSRDKRTFGRISSSDHTLSISVEGPARSWASPETSYRYPTAIPERSCPSVPHPTNGFQETVSFKFTPIAPAHSDETCAAGKLFLNYQKSIIYDEGCCSMHIASWPDDLQRLDLLINWKSPGSASSFHSSASEIEHIAALSPHLSSPPDPLRSPGFPFQQFGIETGDNWAEMVDFVLPADASDLDRRALEWFIAKFIR
ncbi:MAG: hypothetical protein Q9164_007025 [Protoblastenia rupestris]